MSMMRPTAHSVALILATQLDVAVERIVPTACLFVELRALPLALVRASLALEEAFGVVIPDDELAKVSTVEHVMALVAQHSRLRMPPACAASGATRRSPTRASRRIRRGRWA